MTTQISAVVINLDRHKDRMEWFDQQAAKVGVAVERLSAIDASKLTDTADCGLSRAEYACLQSHRRAWQMLLEAGGSHLAIFEDDAHLSEDMAVILSSGKMISGVDLLKLEWPLGKVVTKKSNEGIIANRHLHKLLSKAYGAAGYIVSARCAKRLLAVTDNPSAPVDVVLFDPESPLWREIVPFQMLPAACIQDHALAKGTGRTPLFASSIESGRNERRAAPSGDKRRRDVANSVARNKLVRHFSNMLQGAGMFGQKKHCPLELGSTKREKLIAELKRHDDSISLLDIIRMKLSIGVEVVSGKELKAFYLDAKFWPNDGVTLHRDEQMNVNGTGFEDDVDVMSLDDTDSVAIYGGTVSGNGQGMSFRQYLGRWRESAGERLQSANGSDTVSESRSLL